MARLETAITEFVGAHPNGWSHWEWEQFLASLSARKVKVSNADEVGALLEAERLRRALQGAGVAGLGPRRVEALVQRFGSVANLRSAGPDQLGAIPTVPRRMLEETVARLFAR